ncbi:hypothetical protein [Pseudonocardia sp. T1-2H]|uniref:hypothetical protein n=1 Tax=Pseudonocardia sp. T1-2H TaxID=3128899 RepID=UPI003100C963
MSVTVIEASFSLSLVSATELVTPHLERAVLAGGAADLQVQRAEGGHLLSRVAAPPFVRGNLFALHEEGVRSEHGAVADRHPVVDERTHPDRGAGTDRDPVGLEGVVLLGVALQGGAGVEGDVVADSHEVLLGHGGPVVEEPLADVGAHHPEEHGLVRRAGEDPVQPDPRAELEEPFRPPEVDLIDRAVRRLQAAESRRGPFHQREVEDAEDEEGDVEHDDRPGTERVVEVEGHEGRQGEHEVVEPAHQQEPPHRGAVVLVLRGEQAREVLPVCDLGELAVAGDRSRDLEGGRAQQADALPDLPVDRDQDLRREEAVRPGSPLRGVDDVVAQEVVRPDRSPGEAEGRARVVGVDEGVPAGDHRSTADGNEERILVLHLDAEVRPGLHEGEASL